MAKRKRLTPANPQMVDTQGPASPRAEAVAPPVAPPLPDAAPLGAAPARPAMTALRAPIAGVASDASSTAALEEISATLLQARRDGQMVVRLPLDQIDPNHLVRDRVVVNDAEMEALVASLKARGQQTPIEVVDLGGDRYGLISGWRRCQALTTLRDQGGGDGQVLALLRRPQRASDAYVAMVEENEIRVGLSYFERARIAALAVQQGVFETDKQALNSLFNAASRAKRSKIKSFLPLVAHLDGVLRFPGAVGERLGLQLSQRLGQDPQFAPRLVAALRLADVPDAEAEQTVLSNVLNNHVADPPAHVVPPSASKAAVPQSKPASPQVMPSEHSKPAHHDHAVGRGVVVRVYGDGRLEVRGTALPVDVQADLVAWLGARLDSDRA